MRFYQFLSIADITLKIFEALFSRYLLESLRQELMLGKTYLLKKKVINKVTVKSDPYAYKDLDVTKTSETIFPVTGIYLFCAATEDQGSLIGNEMLSL